MDPRYFKAHRGGPPAGPTRKRARSGPGLEPRCAFGNWFKGQGVSPISASPCADIHLLKGGYCVRNHILSEEFFLMERNSGYLWPGEPCWWAPAITRRLAKEGYTDSGGQLSQQEAGSLQLSGARHIELDILRQGVWRTFSGGKSTNTFPWPRPGCGRHHGQQHLQGRLHL